MASVLLMYEKLPEWSATRSLILRQQAVYAAARSILTEDRSDVPERSAHRVLAPRILEILPILAIAARDYTYFAEPEGGERPSAPITLYHDPAFSGEMEAGGVVEGMEMLLHPAWFDFEDVNLAGIVRSRAPEICIAVGDPRSAVSAMRDMDHLFQRILLFDCNWGKSPGGQRAATIAERHGTGGATAAPRRVPR